MTQRNPKRPPFSVVILAGGRSLRMQSDKAFLVYRGSSFISRIVAEASRVCENILVVIGEKEKGKFEADLGKRARVVNDAHHPGSPLAGMLTAFDLLKDGYAAVIACDTPLVKGEVLEALRDLAVSHSAAVPLWESGKIEPLCSVYHVGEAREASVKAIEAGRLKCRDMISLLPDVNYVPVAGLRMIDPSLESLINVNTPGDFSALERKQETADASAGVPADFPADE